MALPAALVAHREDDAGGGADPVDGQSVGDRVGNGLVEKDVLAGGRGLGHRLEVH